MKSYQGQLTEYRQKKKLEYDKKKNILPKNDLTLNDVLSIKDLFLVILSFSSLKEIYKYKRVSKYWKEIVNSRISLNLQHSNLKKYIEKFQLLPPYLQFIVMTYLVKENKTKNLDNFFNQLPVVLSGEYPLKPYEKEEELLAKALDIYFASYPVLSRQYGLFALLENKISADEIKNLKGHKSREAESRLTHLFYSHRENHNFLKYFTLTKLFEISREVFSSIMDNRKIILIALDNKLISSNQLLSMSADLVRFVFEIEEKLVLLGLKHKLIPLEETNYHFVKTNAMSQYEREKRIKEMRHNFSQHIQSQLNSVYATEPFTQAALMGQKKWRMFRERNKFPLLKDLKRILEATKGEVLYHYINEISCLKFSITTNKKCSNYEAEKKEIQELEISIKNRIAKK